MPNRLPSRAPAVATDQKASTLFRLSIGVFFIGGFVASSISLLVPRVHLALKLDYAEATAIQLASFSSYLVFALPIAAIVAACGYMRAHAIGLGLMAIGCLLLIIGFARESYGVMLGALLGISTGATFLQIASNSVITLVGDPRRAAARLNVLQGFNSLGTVLGPAIGATTIVAAGTARPEAGPVLPFGVATLVIAALSLAFFLHRGLLGDVASGNPSASPSAWSATLRDRRLLAGAVAIFSYVGAEVAIGALLTDFLMTRHALGWSPAPAAGLVTLYWGGAMVGRFAGAAILRHVPAARLLAYAAVTAAALVCCAVIGTGPFAAAALLAVGLANAIMYPTIFVLALPDRPERAAPGAMVLCIAVVGGAIVPFLTGVLADRIGLVPALLLPGACYLPILAFAVRIRRQHPAR